MAESEVRIINGKTFTVTPFTFFRGNKILIEIGAIIAPVFSKIVGSFTGDIEKLDISKAVVDGDALASALETLFTKLDGDQFEKLLLTIFSNTQAEVLDKEKRRTTVSLNSEAMFDLVFGRDLTTMIKAVAFVAEVSYPDFFLQGQVIGERIQTVISSTLGKSSTTNT